jgi:hypothetical protein
MIENTTYYALLLDGDSLDSPSGIARRRLDEDGELSDESFKRDGSWGSTPLIAGAERGDMTFNLVEVSEEEAERIIEGFRARWQAEA